MQFRKERSHLRSSQGRPNNYCAQRMTDETDPLWVEIIGLEIAKDLRNQAIRHGIERIECPALRTKSNQIVESNQMLRQLIQPNANEN